MGLGTQIDRPRRATGDHTRSAPSLRTPAVLLAAGALLLAAALSAALVGIGVAGMTVSAAPRWISLAIEPFSFLLLPGALYAWVQAGLLKVDFSSATVVHACLVFYFAVFAVTLLLRLRPAADTGTLNRSRSR